MTSNNTMRRTSLDDDTRKGKPDTSLTKADQIVQHFFAKTCTIVSQSRMTHISPSNNNHNDDDPTSSLGAADSPSASTSGTATNSNLKRGSGGGTMRRASTPAERAKSVHKWFNIEIADSDHFRNELRAWRSVSSLYPTSHSNSPSSSHPNSTTPLSPNAQVSAIPPMILEILLDTSEMLSNQVLVISDQRGRRIRVDPALSRGSAMPRRASGVNNVSAPSSGMRSPLGALAPGGGDDGSGRSNASPVPHTVVLERWTLTVVPHQQHTTPNPSSSTPPSPLPPTTAELPAVYKRAIVHFRSLYSMVRILPSWNLHRRLNRRRVGTGLSGNGGGYRGASGSSGLMIGCRMSMSEAEVQSEEGKEGEIRLDVPIAETDGKEVTETLSFPIVATPIGGLRLTCTYRLNVEFAVEDIETLLSSRFIDEDFFKPTMARYQQETSLAGGRPGSLPLAAPNKGTLSPSTSPPMTGFGPKPSYGSLSSRHHLVSPPSGAVSSSSAVPITRVGGAQNDLNRSSSPAMISASPPRREGSVSSSGGRLSVYGSSGVATGGQTVEPAFISLSRARGAASSSQIQRATVTGSGSTNVVPQQILGSSVPRRPSFTTSGTSPMSSSPIFRASSYLSSPPTSSHTYGLSSSPSTGPTSNIHRVGSGGVQTTSNNPSSLGLGFARQQQQTGLVASSTSPGSNASSSSPTITSGTTPMMMVARSPLSGAGSPASAPRPIPSPASGSMPRYSTSGGSYARSYGRGSSGGGSYSSLTGNPIPISGAEGYPWTAGYDPSTRRTSSTSIYSRPLILSTPEPDPKRFIEGAEDDSDEINAFLGLIDSRPELMKASMIASRTSAAGRGGEGLGGELSTKTQVDEQLKALRGSVYGQIAGTSPPLGFGLGQAGAPGAGLGLSAPSSGTSNSRTASYAGLRKQTSRLSIEEEPATVGGVMNDRGFTSGTASRVSTPDPTKLSLASEAPSSSSSSSSSSAIAAFAPLAVRPIPSPRRLSPAASAVTQISFPQYVSPRTRAAPALTTTAGFDLPPSAATPPPPPPPPPTTTTTTSNTTTAHFSDLHHHSVGRIANSESTSTTGTPPMTGHSSTASFSSMRSTSAYAAEEEAVGHLELDDEEEDDQEPSYHPTPEVERVDSSRSPSGEADRRRGRWSPPSSRGGGGGAGGMMGGINSSREPTPGGMQFRSRTTTAEDYFGAIRSSRERGIIMSTPPVSSNPPTTHSGTGSRRYTSGERTSTAPGDVDLDDADEVEDEEEEDKRRRSPGVAPWLH